MTHVEEMVTALAEAPMIGIARTCRNPALTGLRMLPVRGFSRHLIFYRPMPDKIEIVRVLHGARDLRSTPGR